MARSDRGLGARGIQLIEAKGATSRPPPVAEKKWSVDPSYFFFLDFFALHLPVEDALKTSPL
jgi:hypothetical protein